MRIQITKEINAELLREQLYAVFPAWVEEPQTVGLRPVEFFVETVDQEAGTREMFLSVPEGTDEQAVQAVIADHDHTGLSQFEIELQNLNDANVGFKTLPTWATISPADGRDYVVNNVWGGQTEAQISAWVDANVNTLAQAKTALKQLAAAVVALRDMEGRLAQGLLYLRDLTIK